MPYPIREYTEGAEEIRELIRQRIISNGYEDKDARYEVYEGVIYAMSQPSGDHQIIQHGLTRQLEDFFRGRKCQTMPFPFGVNLTKFVSSKKKTFFLPDITVIRDPSQYDRRTGTYYAAPSFVVEVSSPSTRSRDLGDKKNTCELAGVPAYLFVEDRYSASLFVLENGIYTETVYEAEEGQDMVIPVSLYSDLTLSIKQDWFWFSDGT